MSTKKLTSFLLFLVIASASCMGQNSSVTKNESKILSFQEGLKNVPIDEANKKIVFSVPPFIDLTKITPSIKVSDGATLSPASDTEQDFSKPFVYTVTAADGSKNTYTVIASKREGGPSGGLPPQISKAKPMTNVSLTFDPSKFTAQTQEFQGKSIKVRAYERVIYVANPADAGQEVLNIYVPEEYFNGGSINGYTATTAPIFFPNKVGGYMPAQPATFMPQSGGGPGGPPSAAVVMALSKGYVVASAGARGRTSPTGKAPAGIVDLKAAIRYLKFNDKNMAGDANKIISNGTSAGGAMSSLLGATGNHPDYEPFLKAIGAANATDDVFAVSAYCPISNLENADMAYEWQLNKIRDYKGRGGAGTLNEAAIKVSDDLKKAFPNYLNGLNLKNNEGKKLSLEANGEGNFKDLVNSYIVASAQKALDSGIDLSKYGFLKINTNKVSAVDFDNYMIYLEHMKTPPAFDALDNKSFENSLFGNETIENRHFTSYAFQNAKDTKPLMADAQQIKMMNPMSYIGDKTAKTAKHWRVRHGAKDRDTGFAVPVILATTLKNKGFNIDFVLPWDKPHSGDYDLDELFGWVDKIVRGE